MEENYQGPEPEHIRTFLKELGRSIKDKVPNGWGFTLLLFDYDKGQEGSILYLSSAKREDMVKAMREFLSKHEKSA